MEGLSGDFQIEVNNLDISTLGPLFVLIKSDIQASGKISADMTAEVENGALKVLEGKIDGSDLKVTPEGLKGDSFATSKLTVDVKIKGNKDIYTIDSFDMIKVTPVTHFITEDIAKSYIQGMTLSIERSKQ